jgi:hypothetical protein
MQTGSVTREKETEIELLQRERNMKTMAKIEQRRVGRKGKKSD